MRARIDFLPSARDDLKALPTFAMRLRAVSLIGRLRLEPFLGLPLQKSEYTGDLTDCRKLYLDERIGISPRFRIVYRVISDEHVEVVEVITIGRRHRSFVYHETLRRLGRL